MSDTRSPEARPVAPPGALPSTRDAWASLWSDPPAVAYLGLFYAAYIIACAFSRQMQVIPGHTTAFWPASGIFVATLLSTRRGTWPWWVAAGCLAEVTCNLLWFRNPLPAALGFYLANALEALAAAWLLTRFVADPFHLATPKEVAGLVVLAAGIAPVVGATVGSATHHLLGRRSFTSAWTLWWLGDASGLLVSLPLVLAALHVWKSRGGISAARLTEAAILAATLIGTAMLAAAGWLATIYITLPPLLWASLRFRLEGAAAALAVIALVSAAFAATGTGAFAGAPEDIRANAVMLQTFFAISAISALLVATLSRQHQQALQELERVNRELERRVLDRTARLSERDAQLRLAHEAAGLGAWQYDLTTRTAVWSRRARELIGVDDATAASRELLFARIHPDDRDRMKQAIAELATPGRPGDYHVEFRVVHDDGRVLWLEDQGRVELGPDGAPTRVNGVARDITGRKLAEERLRLLLREVHHRSKNMLGLVRAVAQQTAQSGTGDFLPRFLERIQALAANQDLLVRSDWRGVAIGTLVRSQLAPFADLIGSRLLITGPDLLLTAEAAQTLGMAVHELATNAGKYGALSCAQGRVEIAWGLRPLGGRERFFMTWRETEGPAVEAPTQAGFGSVVTTTMARMTMDADVEVTYARTGLAWSLECDAAQVVESGNAGSGLA